MQLLLLIAVALFFAVAPYALSLMIQHLRPVWPRWRKIVAAGLPLPFGVAAMSGVIFLRASLSCGTGDCSLAMIFGMGGLILGAMGAVLGLAVSAVALRKE